MAIMSFYLSELPSQAPLPKNWKPCKTKDTEDIYYFNFLTGERYYIYGAIVEVKLHHFCHYHVSTWDHPCDGYYKRLYEEEKKKKEVSLKV